MRATLRKSCILRGYSAFSMVIVNGESAGIPPIRIFWKTAATDRSRMRVGFATSKQFRSAASRNRLKRLMREAFRLERAAGTIGEKVPVDIVLMFVGAKEKESARMTLEDVRPAVAALLSRVAGSGRREA